MKVFAQLEMVELLDDQTIFMTESNQLLGCESVWAEKKRRYRQREDNVLDESSTCLPSVRQEKELEKELELEIDKESKGDGKAAPNTTKTDYDFYVSSYNSICANLPKCRMLTEKRKKAIRSFEKQLSKDQFSEVCQKANISSFCSGENGRGWKADFDFLIRPDKATSILEGKYDGKDQGFEYSYDFEPGTSL